MTEPALKKPLRLCGLLSPEQHTKKIFTVDKSNEPEEEVKEKPKVRLDSLIDVHLYSETIGHCHMGMMSSSLLQHQKLGHP